MDKITKQKTREIIDDFAKAIDKTKQEAEPPKIAVINFRNEARRRKERTVYEVPTELLRYRKDNGRIRISVASYEKEHGLLTERDKPASSCS